MKVMKECLNVSQQCASDGVLGEVGMIPDAGSADRQHLQLLRRFMSAPEDSIPGRFAAAGMSFDSKSSFFTQGKALMAALGIKTQKQQGTRVSTTTMAKEDTRSATPNELLYGL